MSRTTLCGIPRGELGALLGGDDVVRGGDDGSEPALQAGEVVAQRSQGGDFGHGCPRCDAFASAWLTAIGSALESARPPMSRRWCSPSQRIRATVSYARRAASSRVAALAPTASTRPPLVTTLPSGSRLVPAWKTKAPGGEGGVEPLDPVAGARRRRGIPPPPSRSTSAARCAGAVARARGDPRAPRRRGARTSRRRRSGRAPWPRDRRSGRCTRAPAARRDRSSGRRRGRREGARPRRPSPRASARQSRA